MMNWLPMQRNGSEDAHVEVPYSLDQRSTLTPSSLARLARRKVGVFHRVPAHSLLPPLPF